MKIGIEVQRLFRKQKFGIETSSLELVRTLREMDSKNEFVIFAKDDADHNCLEASANLKIKTVAGKLFVDFEQFFLPVAAANEHVDILHCTGNTAPLFSPVPVVQTLHDVIFMDAIPATDTFYQRFGNHYRRKMVPLVTPRSRAVITVSQYEKERIVQRLGIPREKIHVVYNGINEQHFKHSYSQAQQDAVRKKYQLPDNFILFLGNEAARKNAGRVVEAYVKYSADNDRAMPLVTPGLSQQFIIEKLKALDYPYSTRQFVTPGYIADEDLPVLYNLCHIFLFPSLSEGFGMPLAEAMACGAPVVTSNISCLPEIAGNAAVLTDPLKAEEIASGIFALATNEELRQKKIQMGLHNAKRFSWQRAAERVLGLYEAVFSEAQAMQKQTGFFQKYVFAPRH